MPFFSTKQVKWFFYKSFSLLSVIRGYNLLIIITAQYLTSIFILSHKTSVSEVLMDSHLCSLIIASVIAIASGYIINNFYDSEKDLINRPQKSKIDRLISQRSKLVIYFLLNFLTIIIASYNSFKAVIFFSMYIFGIWLYSHKLKQQPFLGNITATILAMLPFFAIFIYYKNYEPVIFLHAIFLFLIIFMREMIKDLENLTGDILVGYHNFPIKYGESASKKILLSLSIITIIISLLLANFFPLGKMNYYFFLSSLFLTFFTIILLKSFTKKEYLLLHNILKIIIFLGVLSIVLINPNLVLKN